MRIDTMTKIEKLLNKIDRLLNSEIDTDNIDEKVKVIKTAIRLSEKLVETASEDADSYYMLGLCWYNFPRCSNERSWRVRFNLLKALTIEPDHQFANQYLGYLYFDQDKLKEALNRFRLTDHSYFISIDQHWRSLKAKELALVCEIRLHTNGFSLSKLDSFLWEYLNKYEQDKIGVEWPVELKQCAEWLFENGKDINDPIVHKIVLLTKRIGMTFWNKELTQQIDAL